MGLRATVLGTTHEPASADARAARGVVVARGAAPWAAAVGPWAMGAVGALAALAAGCGAPNPRILEATEAARGMPSTELGSVMTEQEKIQAIIAAVRKSGHVFVHDGIARDGAATAAKLQLLLERDPTGVRSARELIDRLAAPERTDEDPDRVVLAKGSAAEEGHSVPARHWYLSRLAELEGRPPPDAPPEERRKAEDHARRLLILDALAIVEHSTLKFVAPPRPAANGSGAGPGSKARGPKPGVGKSSGPKRKPKRKEYTGAQFADMLRKKWEFLGADIQDLDTFIGEIASDSFASMVRYRVVLDDGREEDFGVWLRAQLAASKTVGHEGDDHGAGDHEAPTMGSALAQGGAP